eukprot:UN1056
MITHEELMEGSRRCGLDYTAEDIANIMESYDRTGQLRGGVKGGLVPVYEIHWNDFQAALIFRARPPTDEQLRYVFRRFTGEEEVITPQSLQESLSSNLFCLGGHHHGSSADYVPATNDGEVVSREEIQQVFGESGSYTGLQGYGAAQRIITFNNFRAMFQKKETSSRKRSY